MSYFSPLERARGEVFFLLLLPLIFSCTRTKENKTESETHNQPQLKEQLVRVNKSQTHFEQNQIEDFLARYNYQMDSTQTGLRYFIYKKQKGKSPGKKSIVEIKYEVKLLDGTVCYNSNSTGNLEFQIGKTDLPVGLQEGVQLMSVGEKAIFISPSKLGYGLTGDGDNIPPNAVLVYDVELKKVK